MVDLPSGGTPPGLGVYVCMYIYIYIDIHMSLHTYTVLSTVCRMRTCFRHSDAAGDTWSRSPSWSHSSSAGPAWSILRMDTDGFELGMLQQYCLASLELLTLIGWWIAAYIWLLMFANGTDMSVCLFTFSDQFLWDPEWVSRLHHGMPSQSFRGTMEKHHFQ